MNQIKSNNPHFLKQSLYVILTNHQFKVMTMIRLMLIIMIIFDCLYDFLFFFHSRVLRSDVDSIICREGCEDGKYSMGGECFPCHSTCETCNGGGIMDCTQCTQAFGMFIVKYDAFYLIMEIDCGIVQSIKMLNTYHVTVCTKIWV